MSRAVKSRSALAACLVALFVISVPVGAQAAPAATEQYVLTLPGVERGRDVGVVPDPELEPAADAGDGVTGENAAAAAPLSAFLAVASSPWVLLTIAAVGAVALVVTRRGREPR